MTRQDELNRLMAIDVMGWQYDGEEEGRLELPAYIERVGDEFVERVYPATDWNPCENIEQALLLPEKLSLYLSTEQIIGELITQVTLKDSTGDIRGLADAKKLPRAIVEAIAQVKGEVGWAKKEDLSRQGE